MFRRDRAVAEHHALVGKFEAVLSFLDHIAVASYALQRVSR